MTFFSRVPVLGCLALVVFFAVHRERTIQELLNRGWVPLLLRWLGLVHRPNLQVETLSALTTVAQNTTEHTALLVKVRASARWGLVLGRRVALCRPKFAIIGTHPKAPLWRQRLVLLVIFMVLTVLTCSYCTLWGRSQKAPQGFGVQLCLPAAPRVLLTRAVSCDPTAWSGRHAGEPAQEPQLGDGGASDVGPWEDGSRRPGRNNG